jgi:hypothetical protein
MSFMNTKTLVSLALLIGIGAVLHAIIPGFILGMKPDMMLMMMFLGIILFPGVKNVLILGIVTGIISGLTSTFPGGFVPNIIDKTITSFIFFGLFVVAMRFGRTLAGVVVLTAIGTLVSGAIFLGSASVIVGLPGSFTTLYVAVVLPAAALNAVAIFILYPIVSNIFKRTSLTEKSVA